MIRPATPLGRRRTADPADPADPVDPVDLEVLVTNEQSDHPIDVDRWEALAREVLEAEGIGAGAELALVFVDETAMARLNVSFMGQSGPTDVLAFPLDGEDASRAQAGGGQPLLLGDVAICPAVAARNAPDHAGSFHAGTYDGEIALLVVHGILHVLGMDHVTAEQAEAMDAGQHRMLERWRNGPAVVPIDPATTPGHGGA